MNPFESFVQVLFSPRRFYSRPHRYEEGLLWAGLGVVAGSLMPASDTAGPPPLWTVIAVGSSATSLSAGLYLMARFFGGKGDFETAFSGAAIAFLGVLGPLALLGLSATAQPEFDADFARSLAGVAVLGGLWLLVMIFQNLSMLHRLPWWKALLVTAMFVLSCVPLYGGVVWLIMGVIIGMGLLMTARSPG